MPLNPLCETDLSGQKVNYCPFGCKTEDLDEYGHCPHLVGYTNECTANEFLNGRCMVTQSKLGRTYEAVAPLVRKSFSTGKVFDTGYKCTFGGIKGSAVKALELGDFLVNPQVWQEADQYQAIPAHFACKWQSARVYRESANNPLSIRPPEDESFDLPLGHKAVAGGPQTVTLPEPQAKPAEVRQGPSEETLLLRQMLARMEKQDDRLTLLEELVSGPKPADNELNLPGE